MIGLRSKLLLLYRSVKLPSVVGPCSGVTTECLPELTRGVSINGFLPKIDWLPEHSDGTSLRLLSYRVLLRNDVSLRNGDC
ncbi:unnamed protein product [Angiostrongylus costaricensis]|uniref:Secreted protein n=1 Tax=Angiostrongylus costaricensis TaxID=334426 RepID=A0A0R3PYE6_ANGCS|nr:unnamed protein product [Angiostrongylus costaricensis]